MSDKPKALHSYFGGKTRIGKDFLKNYTPKDIKIYVEPFSGSFAVYFFTPLNDDTKAIFNDFNKDQANLFYCSKKYDKFLEKLNYHLYDKNGILYCKDEDIDERKKFYRELYYSFKRSDFSQREFELGDYDRASIYAFLLTSAFNSVHYMAGGYSGFNKNRMKILSFINKLKDEYIRERLDKISEIHSMDFEELIKKYDSPDTYFYLDPPYWDGDESVDSGKRVGWYGASDIFDGTSHKRLCDLLKTLKGKWALSYYEFDKLSEWLPKDEYTWVSKDFFRSSASFSENKSTKGTELLIMNYELTDEEIEENKKFLNVKPTRKKKVVKTTEPDASKITKEVGDYIKKVVDNIEVDEFLDFEKELISKQTDVDSEFVDIVNENFDELIDSGSKKLKTEEEIIDKIEELNDGAFIVSEDSKKIEEDYDVDDFWLS